MRTVLLTLSVLVVLWTSTQAQPDFGIELLSSLSYAPGIEDIKMVGNVALTMAVGELHAWDLADPAHPVDHVQYDWHDLLDTGGGMCVDSNRLFLAVNSRGVILDISDPLQMTVIGQWDDQELNDFYLVHESWAIYQGSEGYPGVLDISDIGNVHQIGQGFGNEAGPMKGLGMAGEYLCMIGYPGGVAVYDMSVPGQPQRVAACDTGSYRSDQGVISGHYALLGTWWNGVHIIDLADPLNPSLVAVLDSAWGATITMSGTFALVNELDGVNPSLTRIYDVADPAQPVLVTTLDSIMFRDGAATNNLWCAVNAPRPGDDSLVCVLDVSNHAAPTLRSKFLKYGLPKRMAIRGSIACVADGRVGIRTIDLSDLGHVTDLASILGHSRAAGDVAWHDHYVYAASDGDGIFVYDIANPAQPESLGCVSTPPMRSVVQLLATEDYLYDFDAGVGTAHLLTFSLANPALPMLVDSLQIFPLSEWGYFGVAADNSHLYLVQGWNNFTVLSLANPAHPVPSAACALPSFSGAYANNIAVSGNRAYVADYAGGLVVIDNAATSPAVIAQIGNDCSNVAASGSVVAEKTSTSIIMLDLSDPANPITLGSYAADGEVEDMQLIGSQLYVSSASAFSVYRLDSLVNVSGRPSPTPGTFALGPAFPNPFNPFTVLCFSLPRTEHATLTIYDITGRQVQTLSDGVWSAGEHEVRFDGSQFSSGVYFARFEAGKDVRTEKLMLLK